MKLCPRCHTTMKLSAFDGRLRDPASGQAIKVEMDHCEGCGGHWFDRFEAEATMGLRGELRQLGELALSQPTCHRCDLRFPSGTSMCLRCASPLTMACPSCRVPMIPVRVQGITLDSCGSCLGLWFDGDELKRLNESLRVQGTPLGGEADYITCASCQRSGLSRQETYHSSNGLICESCMRGAEVRQMHARGIEEERRYRQTDEEERETDEAGLIIGTILEILLS